MITFALEKKLPFSSDLWI